VNVREYDPSLRAPLAELMGRVWGKRPSEEELAWFYEQNPVRPASVLLAEEGGRVVSTSALGFVPMSIGGRAVEVGMAVRAATDPAYRGRGIFADLMRQNEERVRELGVPLLLSVTNAASTPVFVDRLGWSRLEPIRLWARAKLLRGRTWARPAPRFGDLSAEAGVDDCVLRDAAWLNWRFADGPRSYTRLVEEGYAVAGRWHGCGILAAMVGDLFRDAASAAGGPLVLAAPPPSRRSRYLFGGYLPTPKTFTVLGKSLDPAFPLPERPHFELGDLDFV
jgi:GNAT superfamily N-acetyltransferase